MNYIILDLEWNQSYHGQIDEDKKLPFEIIEIGATKLDEEFNIIDHYGSIVKPRLYKKLNVHIRPLLNYDESVLRKGRPFDVVFREFRKWCNHDFIFCTWGPIDLTILQQNMDYYHLNNFTYPLKYYNLQQIYAIENYNNYNHTPSLEKAVKELNITIEKPFHSAINDAYYTSYVFQKMNHRILPDLYSIDYFHHPTCMEEELIFKHNNYYEYITRTFSTKQEALEDKDISTLRCYKCNKKLKKKIKWFVIKQNTQVCVGKCWNHGLNCGKIKFKNTPEGDIFIVKTVSKISKSENERIIKRQNEIRQKRKEKRNNK